MGNLNLSRHYSEANHARSVLSYQGFISQAVVEDLGNFVRNQLPPADSRRVFAVFVELSQNILRYSTVRDDHPDGERGHGLIAIEEMGEKIVVSSANPVVPGQVARVQAWVERIRSLDGEGLRQLFIERRRGEPPPGSKGAGLGLIDIARRCGGELLCESCPLDGPGGELLVLRAVIAKQPLAS